MTAGQPATLTCGADTFCKKTPDFNWEWTKADGQSTMMRGDDLERRFPFRYRNDVTNRLRLTPTADDHNTNITCVADYGDSAVKTTVTLTVECKCAAVFL